MVCIGRFAGIFFQNRFFAFFELKHDGILITYIEKSYQATGSHTSYADYSLKQYPPACTCQATTFYRPLNYHNIHQKKHCLIQSSYRYPSDDISAADRREFFFCHFLFLKALEMQIHGGMMSCFFCVIFLTLLTKSLSVLNIFNNSGFVEFVIPYSHVAAFMNVFISFVYSFYRFGMRGLFISLAVNCLYLSPTHNTGSKSFNDPIQMVPAVVSIKIVDVKNLISFRRCVTAEIHQMAIATTLYINITAGRIE